MSKLRTDQTLAQFKQRATGNLPSVMGIEIVELLQDQVKGRMPIQTLHMAPNGYLHAASVIALADTTCGFATMAHLPEGATSFTTIELKSNHLGTLREGVIACIATAQHLGKNTHVWDAVVSDEQTGKKIALFRCTQMILWPKREP